MPTQNTQDSELVVNNLKQRLGGFAVHDQQGGLLGDVSDLLADSTHSKRFNLVISQRNSASGVRLFLLNSKYLVKVDAASRSLFTTLNAVNINQLPDYQPSNSSSVDPLSHHLDDASDNNLETQQERFDKESDKEFNAKSEDNSLETTISPNIISEQAIHLLEERLLVNSTKRKAGEIVIRKAVETRFVEVPIRREKLIIEQIGSPDQPLAVIDIASGDVTGIDFSNLADVTDTSPGKPIVKGKFSSLKTVSQLLDVITKTIHYRCNRIVIELLLNNETQRSHHEFPSLNAAVTVLDAIAAPLNYVCKEIQVELTLDDPEAQSIYQKWFDHYGRF